jgi:hypothetical protein
MNAEQLKIYKREKSRQFNANLKALRLKDKAKKQKRTSDTDSDDETLERTIDNQEHLKMILKGNPQDKQADPQADQDDGLTLADLLFKIEDLENKIDNLLETKLDELLDKLDIMETIIETKLETKTNQPLKPFERPRFKLQHSVFA